MFKSTHIYLLISVMGLVLFAGCSFIDDPEEALINFQPMDPPVTQVLKVEQVESTDQGAALQVYVELDNSVNPSQLPLPWAAYQVNVEGVGAFTGETLPNATSPKGETIVITLPAAVALNGRDTLVGATYTVTGYVCYQPPGRFWRWVREDELGLPTTDFSGTGSITLGAREAIVIDVEVTDEQAQDPGQPAID